VRSRKESDMGPTRVQAGGSATLRKRQVSLYHAAPNKERGLGKKIEIVERTLKLPVSVVRGRGKENLTHGGTDEGPPNRFLPKARHKGCIK